MNTFNPFSLKDKTILVTGASSGIGAQTAIDCSKMGGEILLLGRNSERLEKVLDKLEGPQEHKMFSMDLTDFESVENWAAGLNKDHLIHGIVNAAGISTTLPFKFSTPQKMDEFFRTNVHGSVNLFRVLQKNKVISGNGASIVFISSVMGSLGENGKSLYGMTKGAITALVKSLAVEFASKRIRVNSISPSVVESPMSANAVYSKDPALLEKVISMHPLGLGKPEDVAAACIYLLSDAARWVSGTNLFVDGAYSAR